MPKDSRLERSGPLCGLFVISLALLVGSIGPVAAENDLPPEQVVTEDQVPQMLAEGWARLESDPRVLFKDLNGNGQIEVPEEITAVLPEQP